VLECVSEHLLFLVLICSIGPNANVRTPDSVVSMTHWFSSAASRLLT
jgi:hypothetical protein